MMSQDPLGSELDEILGSLVDPSRPVVQRPEVADPTDVDPLSQLTGVSPAAPKRGSSRRRPSSSSPGPLRQTHTDMAGDPNRQIYDSVPQMDPGEVFADLPEPKPTAKPKRRKVHDESVDRQASGLDFSGDFAPVPHTGHLDELSVPDLGQDLPSLPADTPAQDFAPVPRSQARAEAQAQRRAKKDQARLDRQRAKAQKAQTKSDAKAQKAAAAAAVDDDFDPFSDIDDLDLDSLADRAVQIEKDSNRRKLVRSGVIGAVATALVALVIFVLVPMLMPKPDPLQEADWYSEVSKVSSDPEGLIPGTDAAPDWTIPSGQNVQSSVYSAGILKLTNATLQIIDPADGSTVLAQTDLTEPIDYTLEAEHQGKGVIAWMTGDQLQYWVQGDEKVSSWTMPDSAGAASPGGGILVQTPQGKTWAALPGSKDLVEVVAPEGTVIAAVNDQFATAVSTTSARAMLIPVGSSDFPEVTVNLQAPFEEATMYGTVYAGHGKAVLLWTGGLDPEVLTLSVHDLTGQGEVLSSVPVSAARASRTAWSVGQGAQRATYGQFMFDLENGQAVAELDAQYIFEGSAGHIGYASASGRYIYTDGENTWDDTRKLAGVTSDQTSTVMRSSDGSISGYAR